MNYLAGQILLFRNEVTEADALIDVAARFVALAEVKSLPQGTRDKVYGVLESVYKSRNPDDAEAAGLRALIDSKK